MSQSSLLKLLRTCLDDKHVHKLELVQKLWSDYGEIARYYSPELATNIIVKHVSPPAKVLHPRGWNSQTSHQRKLLSYQIEAYFYQDFADQCDAFCKVPTLIACINGNDKQPNEQQMLVLEDLDFVGFTERRNQSNMQEAKLCISWLAYFHARFLHTRAENLWPVGTYWHLATRQDELAVMPEGELKKQAAKIDRRLNKAQFQTFVHGDAKLANFCFTQNATKVAAVDFQYVGMGVGVKDLAYLLGCCFNDNDLFVHEEYLLGYYFQQLNAGLLHYNISCDTSMLEAEWRTLYAFAWADFLRFLQGWSPGHYKINSYMQHQADIAIQQLVKKDDYV
jgi:hypothetical protein